MSLFRLGWISQTINNLKIFFLTGHNFVKAFICLTSELEGKMIWLKSLEDDGKNYLLRFSFFFFPQIFKNHAPPPSPLTLMNYLQFFILVSLSKFCLGIKKSKLFTNKKIKEVLNTFKINLIFMRIRIRILDLHWKKIYPDTDQGHEHNVF